MSRHLEWLSKCRTNGLEGVPLLWTLPTLFGANEKNVILEVDIKLEINSRRTVRSNVTIGFVASVRTAIRLNKFDKQQLELKGNSTSQITLEWKAACIAGTQRRAWPLGRGPSAVCCSSALGGWSGGSRSRCCYLRIGSTAMTLCIGIRVAKPDMAGTDPCYTLSYVGSAAAIMCMDSVPYTELGIPSYLPPNEGN